MSMAWDEIMSKCPTMKKLIEDKIAAEIALLQQRIAELEAQIVQGVQTDESE